MTEKKEASDKQLMKALWQAQKEVTALVVDKYNNFSNYDYVSSEAIITEGREKLLKNNLVFYRRHWSLDISADFSNAVVKMTFV